MCSSGIAAISGARTPSQISIVRRAPSRVASPPANPPSRDGGGLDREHDGHARRRARRRQHEPRQRDPGHLRAREGDDLAREDPHQPAVAEEVALAHAGRRLRFRVHLLEGRVEDSRERHGEVADADPEQRGRDAEALDGQTAEHRAGGDRQVRPRDRRAEDAPTHVGRDALVGDGLEHGVQRPRGKPPHGHQDQRDRERRKQRERQVRAAPRAGTRRRTSGGAAVDARRRCRQASRPAPRPRRRRASMPR